MSGAARADENSHGKAAALFQEGRRLIDEGNCDAAVTKLKESLLYESSVGARLSIAECVEKMDPLQAWRLLKEASALALVNHDERVSSAEQHAATVQTRLATILFNLPPASDQRGFDLRVDGDVVDRYVYRSGYATTPGRHVVDAMAPGGRVFSKVLTVDAGAHAMVDVELKGEDTKQEQRDAVPERSDGEVGSSRRALGIAIGAIGLSGLASGLFFGVLTLDKQRSIQAACGGNVGSCPLAQGTLDAQRESAKTTAALSTIGFIIGGAGLVGGAAIYLTAPSKRSAGQGTGTTVRLSPRASRDAAGLGLEGFW
jgi:hypothetical protein